MAGVNDLTRQSLPITLAISLIVSAITGTGAAMTSAYSLRDNLMEKLNAEVARSVQQTRQERADALRGYVSKESFADWRQQERVRQDSQYFQLLNAIERLGAKVGRGG